MRVCLSSRQTKEYLSKANEIKVNYQDRKQIFELIENYPNIPLVLSLNTTDEINWDEIEQYNILSKNTIIFIVRNNFQIQKCKELKLSFYLDYAVSTWHEINALKELGVSYIKIAPPLTHQMEKLKKVDVQIRMVPNIAYESYLQRENGVSGGWVRPEDIEKYSEYISIFEFNEPDIKKEQALYRIYTTQNWSGELKDIITNLNYGGLNRMLDPKFTEKRMNCRQACEENNTCHICYRLLDLAHSEKLTPVLEQLKDQT